jgi:elongation factor G
VSSLLFTAGMTPRWGKVAEGTTTTDWDEEEIGRKISIQTGLAYAEWPCTLCSGDKVKINLIDLPGYSTFINEAKASLIGADAALITVAARFACARELLTRTSISSLTSRMDKADSRMFGSTARQ